MSLALLACVLALIAPATTSPPPRAAALLAYVPIHDLLYPLDECVWLDYCHA